MNEIHSLIKKVFLLIHLATVFLLGKVLPAQNPPFRREDDAQPHIYLCCDNCGPNDLILLSELLERQLLLLPKILTEDCLNTPLTKKDQYLFRQQIIKDAEKKMVASTLYDSSGRSLYSHIEFFDYFVRSVMRKRAIKLASMINKAIDEQIVSKDVFILLKEKNTKNSKEVLKDAADAISLKSVFQTKKPLIKAPNSIGILVGLENRTHLPLSSNLTQKLSSNSFAVIGASYDLSFGGFWQLRNSIHGGYVGIDIARPIKLKNNQHSPFALSLQMSSSLIRNLYQTSNANVGIGVEVSFQLFNSTLEQVLPKITMPYYQYLQQGGLITAEFFSPLLNTQLAFSMAFFPFVQSFYHSSYMPFKNFAWEANLSLSSNLYKYFYAKLAIFQHGESTQVKLNERVVTYGQMAYLGLSAQL